MDPKGILKACTAAASEEKNNSLSKVSFRPTEDYYKTCRALLPGIGAEHPIILIVYGLASILTIGRVKAGP